jgi:hypothetical protein
VLRVSENINKSKHHRWSIFCIKQYIKAVYLSLHATNRISLRMQRIESSRSQRRSSVAGRLSVQGRAGYGGGGRGATSPCRLWRRRHGPLPLTPSPARPSQAKCRRWEGRHPPAGTGPGGTCHVSPGQGCRHSAGVFFGKKFQRWSFLTLRWRRWSYVSKILPSGPSVQWLEFLLL